VDKILSRSDVRLARREPASDDRHVWKSFHESATDQGIPYRRLPLRSHFLQEQTCNTHKRKRQRSCSPMLMQMRLVARCRESRPRHGRKDSRFACHSDAKYWVFGIQAPNKSASRCHLHPRRSPVTGFLVQGLEISIDARTRSRHVLLDANSSPLKT